MYPGLETAVMIQCNAFCLSTYQYTANRCVAMPGTQVSNLTLHSTATTVVITRGSNKVGASGLRHILTVSARKAEKTPGEFSAFHGTFWELVKPRTKQIALRI